MEVIFSDTVKKSLEDYRDVLKNYPISNERAHEKWKRMVESLRSLGDLIASPPICMYKDLGQTFDENGNPTNKNLKRYDYKDESGFQWAFACNYNYEKGTITVLKMIPSIFVKEEIKRAMKPLLELTNRVIKVKL